MIHFIFDPYICVSYIAIRNIRSGWFIASFHAPDPCSRYHYMLSLDYGRARSYLVALFSRKDNCLLQSLPGIHLIILDGFDKTRYEYITLAANQLNAISTTICVLHISVLFKFLLYHVYMNIL